jgi:hypothetical protein
MALRRLPAPLTATALAGVLALLAVAAITGQLGHLGCATTGAFALAGFYLPWRSSGQAAGGAGRCQIRRQCRRCAGRR